MTRHEIDKPTGNPDTWPAVLLRLVELGAESWAKLVRVSVLLVLLGGAIWLIASTR